MDADGDQQISPEEFAAAVGRPVVDRPRFDAAVTAAARSLIQAADRRRTGVLDPPGYARLAAAYGASAGQAARPSTGSTLTATASWTPPSSLSPLLSSSPAWTRMHPAASPSAASRAVGFPGGGTPGVETGLTGRPPLAHHMKRCSCDTSFGEASPRTQATDPTGRETLRIRTPFPGLRGKARWLRRRVPPLTGHRATPWSAKALTSQGCPATARCAWHPLRLRMSSAAQALCTAAPAPARAMTGGRRHTVDSGSSSSPGRPRPRIRLCSPSASGAH